MLINQIKFRLKKKKRIGRGGKKGNYSGRGIKGQKARAGRKIRPAERDIILKLPKLRGIKFKPLKEKPYVVNLEDINEKFNENEVVNKETLVQKKVLKIRKSDKNPKIKILRSKDLRKRVFIILILLGIFRLTANIPLPGVDIARIKNLLQANQYLGLLNIFTGNTLQNFSIALLGLGPYITAVIIMQLLTLVYPRLKEMYYEEGEIGRAKFNQYARILTVPLCILQAFGFLKFLEAQGILFFYSYFEIIRDVIIITCGTIFLMWIGELITEQKLANGISFLIFSGIVARGPVVFQQAIINFSIDKLNSYIFLIVIAILIIACIVFINEAERRIPLNFSKRVRGTKLYGGVSTYLPIKINQAGVIPIIFAISILLFPATFLQILSASGIELFKNLAQDINSFYQGAFIPGIRPGKETAEFLSKTVNRITLFGGIFLGFIAILPYIVESITKLPFAGIGGTSILILVSVAIETLRQIDAELGARRYLT
jgi:preprotein translocase subunit SecY